jgi:hypothetical protein
MHTEKTIGKREFIQHTSKYLKWAEQHDDDLVITHHDAPVLILKKIKSKSIEDLRGFVKHIHGDVNEPVLPGYDEW